MNEQVESAAQAAAMLRQAQHEEPETVEGATPTIPDGYMEDAKGRLVPAAIVKDAEKLEDQLVRTIFGYAEELSAQIARFKGHTTDDITTFLGIIGEQYGVTKGGGKGNVTFTSYDGRLRVAVAIADHLEFGPELQAAKALVDECIAEWSGDADPKLQALVNHAFQVDKAGTINREAVLNLRRMEVDDERWRNAMRAIADSMRVVGAKQYIRIYCRPAPDQKWQQVPLDLAGV